MIKLNNLIWSSKEQVYPFEKAEDGSTIYCKKIDFGTPPNTGTKTVSHGISGVDSDNFIRFWGVMQGTASPFAANPIPYSHPALTCYAVKLVIQPTFVEMQTGWHWNDHYAYIYLIYKK